MGYKKIYISWCQASSNRSDICVIDLEGKNKIKEEISDVFGFWNSKPYILQFEYTIINFIVFDSIIHIAFLKSDTSKT